jgi:ATP-dependent Clp protease ATP-binding subunit ClpC
MFERYTEKARRTIFFARYEASQFGSPYIETEHLLLGLLREDKVLTSRFLRSYTAVESIREQIEAQTILRDKTLTSVDLPLSNECKRVLAYAAEEAEGLGHPHIGCEHLLLGLLREEGSFAAQLLRNCGVDLEEVRKELAATPPGEHPWELEKKRQLANRPPEEKEKSRQLIRQAMELLQQQKEKFSPEQGIFNRFTEETRQAFFFAAEEADRLGQERIGPEHLLLAAISHTDGFCGERWVLAAVEGD